VAGVVYRGAVVVFPDRTLSWAAVSVATVTWESLAPVVEHGGIQILLLGLGLVMTAIPRELRGLFRAEGIVIEPMDTGAACRTFNVLLAEDRPVAAALLPARPRQGDDG
jgi:uncharacterized protein